MKRRRNGWREMKCITMKYRREIQCIETDNENETQ